MKKIYLAFIIFFIVSCEKNEVYNNINSESNNTIELRTSTSCEGCPNLVLNSQLKGSWEGNQNTGNTFAEDKVPFWTNSSSSPHHTLYDEELSNCFMTNLTDEETINCIGSSWLANQSLGKGEAVLTNLELLIDPLRQYCISLDYRELICDDQAFLPGTNIILRIANDIPDQQYDLQYPEYDLSVFNNFGGGEILAEINTEPNNYSTQNFTLENFTPSEDFSQFEIVNMIGEHTLKARSTIEIQNLSINCENLGITEIIASDSDEGIVFSLINESSAEIVKYNWNFGNGENSSEESPVVNFLPNGMHVICVDIVDEYGCCGSACLEIEVQSICDYEFCWALDAPFTGCETNLGSTKAFTNLYVILPGSSLESTIAGSEFNFNYCSSSGGCSDYNGLIYPPQVTGNPNMPIFYEDLNSWFSNNPNYLGNASQGDLDSPCRAGELIIENTNVKFRRFQYIHNNESHPCSPNVYESSNMQEFNCTNILVN